jgi:hypothetical protein
MSPSSLALSNLRAIVILIVLAFHSMLAYLMWVPITAATDFSSPPYAWRSFPIIDDHRFFGFDLICAWQDVYLMALMFFLSGLFVWPSLTRKTNWGFLRDRMLRLGLPFVFGVLVLIPLALYPAYRVTAVDLGFSAYWDAWRALPFWTNGPLWFLWQLLALNTVVIGLHWLAPNAIEALGRWSAKAQTHFARYFIALLAFRRWPTFPWHSHSRRGRGPAPVSSPCNFAGRYFMPFTSLPASVSARQASNAVSSASTVFWRGIGRAGSPPR